MSTDEEVTNSDTEQSKEPIEWAELDADKQHELVALADTLGTQDTTEVVDEEGETWTVGALADLGMTRRQALLAFACLAAGYTLRDAVVRAVIGEARAGTQSAGTIGTVANPADFVSEDNTIVSQSGDPAAPSNANDIVFYNDSGTLKQKGSNGNVSEFGGVGGKDIEPSSVRVDPVTMYVRSTGSDSNDGLTSSSPKATIQAALDDAALADNSAYVVIDIAESGATFTETVSYEPYHPAASIEGTTSGGAPDVTIDGGGAGNTVQANGYYLRLLDVNLRNGNKYNLKLGDGATVRTENVDGAGASAEEVLNSSGYWSDSSDCTWTGSGANRVIQMGSGTSRLGGTYDTSDASTVVLGLEQGQCYLTGTVTGGGSGTTSACVAADKGFTYKIQCDELSGADELVQANYAAFINIRSVTTKSDFNQKTRVSNGSTIWDEERGEVITSMGRTNGTPTVDSNANYYGATVHDDSEGFVRAFSSDQQEWKPLGMTIRSSATETDLVNMELAYDPNNQRLVFRDHNGNAHYWTRDGVL